MYGNALKKHKLYHDKAWLKKRYKEQELTVAQIAKICGCFRGTISRWLGRHGIKKRTKSEALTLSWKTGKRDRERFSAAISAAHARGAFAHVFIDPEWLRKRSEIAKELWRKGIFGSEYITKRTELLKRIWRTGKKKDGSDTLIGGAKWRERQSLAKQKAHERGCYDGSHATGEESSSWRGGLSFLPYSPEFNNRFKRMIRDRDDFRCAVCRMMGNTVHHIDYNKMNTVPENCVTLCGSCHSATNSNRDYWQPVLARIMQARSSFEEA